MVRVSVDTNGKKETNEEESQIHLNTDAQNGDETSPREMKEIPLEEMTKEQLVEKIQEMRALADKNYDLYVRSRAEIENLKKRFQREKEDLVKFSNESLIKELLPVVDNLENAIAHSRDENSLDALREGVELTLKGLRDALQRVGLEEVKAMGEPFDPNFHEAISEMADDTVEPRTVVKELQKGYLLNKRLIRPSMVIVSKKDSPEA